MDSKHQDIPDIVISRLPRYLRALNVLHEKSDTTNSKELGSFLGYSAAQIRKDLSQFGEFGKQGTGYNIEFLTNKIKAILNIDHDWKIILVGCGNIGHAILNYSGFSSNGFHIAAVVDNSPELIGKKFNEDLTIQSIENVQEIINRNNIKIAMLTVPGNTAQKTAEQLVKCGIKGILSYAPVFLNLPPDIKVEYIDPIISLEHITYYLE